MKPQENNILDPELNTSDVPKVLNEEAMGHIIDIIDMQCKNIADRLEKTQKIKTTVDNYTFNANPDSMSTEIGFTLIENWKGNHPKSTHFIITEKASYDEVKKIKNWFERQASKRRWMLQSLVMSRNAQNGIDPDERF